MLGLLAMAKMKWYYWDTKRKLQKLDPTSKIEIGGKVVDAALDALKSIQTDFGYRVALDMYVLGSKTVAEGVCRKWAEDMSKL